jgi:tetraacyldisaccharide-1-P 4'-kinase
MLVTPERLDAGDEARLLASLVPGWPVVQAARREAGWRWLRERWGELEIVLLEDGHQTAHVPRHLDLLILDRWRLDGDRLVPSCGLVAPWGPYREDVSGAYRAAAWLVELEDDPESAAAVAALWSERPLFPFARSMSLAPGFGALGAAAYGVVSGLGQPARFELGCARLMGRPPRLAVRCADHARYDRRQVARWMRAGRRAGIDAWLTTAKDALKLAPLWPATPPLVTVDLSIRWMGRQALPEWIGERLCSPHKA